MPRGSRPLFRARLFSHGEKANGIGKLKRLIANFIESGRSGTAGRRPGDHGSDLREPAVHLEIGAIDVAGLIGRKERDYISNLAGLRIPTERNAPAEVIVAETF